MPAPKVTVRWDSRTPRRRARSGAAKGVKLAAELLLGESNAVVPLEEAVLQRSGAVTVDTQALAAAVSYDTVYAVIQHERLDFKHAPGRTAKYLEGETNKQLLQELVAVQVRRAMAEPGGLRRRRR